MAPAAMGGMGPTGQWARARTTEGAKRLIEERELENSRVRPGWRRLSGKRGRAFWGTIGAVAVVVLALSVVLG